MADEAGSQARTDSNAAGTNRGVENPEENPNEDPKPGSTKKDGESCRFPPPNILQNRMQIFSRVEEAERPSVDKQRKMAESRTDNRNREWPKTRQRDQRENRKPMEKGRRTAVERRSSRCHTSCWPTSCAGLRSTSSSTSASPVRSQFPQTSTRPPSGWRASTPG